MPIDTERYFVICPNVVGGCMGSSGPASTNPATGMPWGLDFPVITVRDMVRAQAMLLDHLGIDSLFAVAGGSMGGMQVLQWAASYPQRVFAALPIAAATRHSAQNIAFHEVGRQAVMADPDWRGGRYFADGTNPRRGLAVARMGAHITYLSDAALHRKFGRRFQDRDNPTFSFDADFQVESYLRHQGITFVERFDANSYLYLTRAMDYFDLAADYDGVVANAFRGTPTRFCVISFTSDWLFPTSESRAIVHALNAAGARVSFAEITTDKGHDAFLLDEPELFAIVRGFLDGAGQGARPARRGDDAVAAQIRSHHGGSRARPGRLAHRLARRRRHGRARRARARRRLRRRRAAAASGNARRRRPRHRTVARGRQRMRRQGPRRGAGRRRHRPRRLSRRRLRFRHPVADAAGDAAAARRARAHAAHRPPRHRVVPEFRPLEASACRSCFGGHMPRTDNLPYAWYETPNIHFCSIKDFRQLCHAVGAKMEQAVALNAWGRQMRLKMPWWFWNLFGEQAVFLLSRRG